MRQTERICFVGFEGPEGGTKVLIRKRAVPADSAETAALSYAMEAEWSYDGIPGKLWKIRVSVVSRVGQHLEGQRFVGDWSWQDFEVSCERGQGQLLRFCVQHLGHSKIDGNPNDYPSQRYSTECPFEIQNEPTLP
jgi:hypothetical protein